MTIVSSGPISIQSIKNEYAPIDQGWNDLNSWGQVVLGRPSGQPVYLSEFYGRTYVPPVQPPTTANYALAHGNIATAHGTVLMQLASPPSGYVLFSNNNPTAWSKTNYFVINGNTVGKGSFEYVGGGGDYYIYWIPDAWGAPSGIFNMTTT